MNKQLILIAVFTLSALFIVNHYLLASQKVDSLPFQENEHLVFKVNYGILNGGTYTMSINNFDTFQGNKCYNIRSTAQTNKVFDLIYKVRDKMESCWDMKNFFSRKYVKRISEGKWKQYRMQYFFPSDTTIYDVIFKKGKPLKKEFKTLENPQDELSVFYYIRLQELNPGDTLYTNVVSGGENYHAKVEVLKKVEIETIFGLKECYLVKPLLDFIIKDTVNMYVWFTADKYKIPVKLEIKVKYGKFTFKLDDAKNIPLEICN